MARITSVLTGRALTIKGIGGPTNARALLPRDAKAYTVEVTLPRKVWAYVESHAKGPYEPTVTPEMIGALEA